MTSKYVWMNGKIVPWEDARIHVDTECAKRGANVFEGIRGYWNADQGELFLLFLDEHIRRLYQSMKFMRMASPLRSSDIARACVDVVRANEFRGDVHLRPTVYFGEGADYGFDPGEISTGVFVIASPRGREPRSDSGLRCCISSWRRITDSSMPPRVKTGANYHNSRLAYMEARLNGFDNVIMLNDAGKLAEAPGACVFLKRGGRWITPTVTSGILESITRTALLQLFTEELGIQVLERDIDRTELYLADEAFLCGTAMEIVPIVSIDHYEIGNGVLGSDTRQMMDLYFRIVRGLAAAVHGEWLTPVYTSTPRPSRVGAFGDPGGRR